MNNKSVDSHVEALGFGGVAGTAVFILGLIRLVFPLLKGFCGVEAALACHAQLILSVGFVPASRFYQDLSLLVILVNEVHLLDITVRFGVDDFLEVDATVDEFLLRDQLAENAFAVLQVLSIEVFALGLFNRSDDLAIKTVELGETEEDLESVELPVLHRVEAEVEQAQELQTLDPVDLPDVLHFVHCQTQTAQLAQLFQALELGDLVLAQVQFAEGGQVLEAGQESETVGTEVQVSQVEVVESVYLFQEVVLQVQGTQVHTLGQSCDLGDLVGGQG